MNAESESAQLPKQPVMPNGIPNKALLAIKMQVLACLLLAASACDAPSVAAHPQRDAIRMALQQAFAHDRDSFVVIEGECDCFVQFMHDNGTLFYDFPNADLAGGIRARALEYHRQQGIDEVVIEDIDPETMQNFSLRTRQKGYGSAEVDAAADAAILALYRIYGQDRDSKFVLIKGWE